jgi:diguanylate cyclase (GGDEF)-like protein
MVRSIHRKRGNALIARLKKRITSKLHSLEPAEFLAIAPVLVVLLSFYTVGLLQENAFPAYVYLFLALILMASGVLGMKTTSFLVMGTIALGEGILCLAQITSPLEAAASGAGLILSATAIPLIARARMLALSTAQNRLTRQQLTARLGVGERLARGATPNPAAPGAQSVASSESLVRNLLLPAKKAVAARTAIFYWFDTLQDALVPVETLSDIPEMLTNAAISLKQGKLTGLKTRRDPTTFRFNPRERHAVPFYKQKVEVTGVLAVPIHHKGALVGAFLFDRVGNDPFFLPENVVAKRLADVVTDSLATERRLKSAVMLSEQLRMMDDAARQFSTARTFDQVYDTAVRYAVSFSPFATAILTHRVSTANDEYEVVGVNQKHLSSLLSRKYMLRGSLCDVAGKAATHLPPNFRFEPRMPQPLGPDIGLELEEDDNCVLIPLMAREEPVGFLLLVDSRRPVVRDDMVSLFLFADYCAVSLVNAEANKELERMATSDPLTGIANHRAFRTRIAEFTERALRSEKEVSLLFIDIDHFKLINDTYGHSAGDYVLKQVARELHNSVRKVDFAARYGGEEFVVLLEETDSAGAVVMAERLRKLTSDLRFPELGSKGITVSIGISTFPTDTTKVDSLVELADAALYRAKNEGRNQCQLA